MKMGGGDWKKDRVLSPEVSHPQTLLSLGITHTVNPLRSPSLECHCQILLAEHRSDPDIKKLPILQ